MVLLHVPLQTYLRSPREQNGNEPEILAPILDELILELHTHTQRINSGQREGWRISASTAANLFVYVDSVKSPLVILQDRRGGHRFIVLGADDDDDQIPLLCEGHNIHVTTNGPRTLWFTVVWRVHLAEEALHEVDLADAPQLLLKNINLKTNKRSRSERCGPRTYVTIRQSVCMFHTCVSKPLCRSRAAKLMTSFTCLSLSAS